MRASDINSLILQKSLNYQNKYPLIDYVLPHENRKTRLISYAESHELKPHIWVDNKVVIEDKHVAYLYNRLYNELISDNPLDNTYNHFKLILNDTNESKRNNRFSMLVEYMLKDELKPIKINKMNIKGYHVYNIKISPQLDIIMSAVQFVIRYRTSDNNYYHTARVNKFNSNITSNKMFFVQINQLIQQNKLYAYNKEVEEKLAQYILYIYKWSFDLRRKL